MPGDAPGIAGIGKTLLEVAHEVVVDARVGLERRLVPEEVGARGAPHRVLAAVPVHVADDARVGRRSAIQEDDPVRPLDERARGNRGEEAVDGSGLVLRGGKLVEEAREALRGGARRGRRRRGALPFRDAPLDTRELSLAAREDGTFREARGRPHDVLEQLEPGALRPAFGARLAHVQRALLGEHDEVVAHQQREAVARLARAPAQGAGRGVDAGERDAAAHAVEKAVVVDGNHVGPAQHRRGPQRFDPQPVALGQQAQHRRHVLPVLQEHPAVAGRNRHDALGPHRVLLSAVIVLEQQSPALRVHHRQFRVAGCDHQLARTHAHHHRRLVGDAAVADAPAPGAGRGSKPASAPPGFAPSCTTTTPPATSGVELKP